MVDACSFLVTNGERAARFNPFRFGGCIEQLLYTRREEQEREREREGKREPKRKKKVQWGDTESLILQGGVTRETRKSSLRIHLILAQELLFLLFI